MLIDHDIKSQDLEAHGVVGVFRLARAVQVGEVGLARRHSLHYNVLDFSHELLLVRPVRLQDVHDGD